MQFNSIKTRKRLYLPFNILVLTVSALSSSNALAVTVTLGASKVSTIFENQPDNSIGKGPAVFVGGDASGSPRRGMIDFNIAANIPVDAIITSAQLTLYLADVAGTGASEDSTPRTIELHRLTSNWAHGPTAINVTTIAGIDQGFPAIPPSPTWNERRFQQNQPWTTPGGDFNPVISASKDVGQTINAAYVWASTPALVADVQAMLTTPSINSGWLLQNSDEWSVDSYRVFYTQVWSDTTLRPQLLLSYELQPVPVPAAVWLFGGGLLGLAGTMRRRAGVSAGTNSEMNP